MLELLAPAGSPDAVIAAVQNGADAVYLGFGAHNARRGANNFTEEEFIKAVRYCHIRGCKVYVTMNTLVSDRELDGALDLARKASEYGADALLVQDLGLVRLLRQAVPDLPLHASTQMSIHNLAGVEAAAELGCTRAVLSRELSLEQIREISRHASIETEVFVHGALCFCYSGQCYMSSLIGRRSGNRGMCAQPCRMQYSMGGRMDDYPLSLKDNCLVDHLRALEDAGVACVKIEGRMKRPEYVGVVTDIYARCIQDERRPTAAEMERLELAFSRQGFTQGYFLGQKGPDMLGTRTADDKPAEKLFSETRRAYGEGERRRVGVRFYIVLEADKPIRAAAEDVDGVRAVVSGPVPEPALKASLTEAGLAEQFSKTGGTPYYAINIQVKADGGLFLPSSAVNDLRRRLITELKEARAKNPPRRSLEAPAMPEGHDYRTDPLRIYQVLTAEQLTPELAALEPDYLYVPAEVIGDAPERLEPFRDRGVKIAAVLPRVVTGDQELELEDLLRVASENGVEEAVVGNLGHILLARKHGMRLRGDFGLNVFNSHTVEMLRLAGMQSVTASFELRLAQIRDLAKTVDTEMIVYGRLPCMITEQCAIKNSAGRCNCHIPNQLIDRRGSAFPVVRAFGCRNVIYNAYKLYLADKQDDYCTAGLWGVRLMFTTENPAECVAVAKSYLGQSDYKPNGLTRGLYYRGVE